jgi:hypothetical protein
MDNGDSPMVFYDNKMVDKGRRDEASPGVWSTSPIASWDGEERWPEELLATTTFGQRWGGWFAT